MWVLRDDSTDETSAITATLLAKKGLNYENVGCWDTPSRNHWMWLFSSHPSWSWSLRLNISTVLPPGLWLYSLNQKSRCNHKTICTQNPHAHIHRTPHFLLFILVIGLHVYIKLAIAISLPKDIALAILFSLFCSICSYPNRAFSWPQCLWVYSITLLTLALTVLVYVHFLEFSHISFSHVTSPPKELTQQSPTSSFC